MPWAAETDWSDFPNAGTLLFQEVERQHQLTTFSSDSLHGSAGMLTWEVETLPGRVSPGEAMATLLDSAQWPRNPGAVAACSYSASPQPVFSLQTQQ